MSAPRHRSTINRILRACVTALLAVPLIASAMFIGAVYLRYWWWPNSGFGDMATKPPTQVFRRVFGQPVPPGVSDIAAAGYVSMGGSDIWLRCRATDGGHPMPYQRKCGRHGEEWAGKL